MFYINQCFEACFDLILVDSRCLFEDYRAQFQFLAQ